MIKYEIKKSWNDGKGLLGIFVHNLKDQDGKQSTKGRNPFEDFTLRKGDKKLSSIVETYDPSYSSSTTVYDHIKKNLSKWVEDAIKIRGAFSKSSSSGSSLIATSSGNATDNKESHQSMSVDLTKFTLEEHVDQSFHIAVAMAEEQPINARHALLAAITVSRTTNSPAFSTLASLLPITNLDKQPTKQTSSMELKALPLDSALAAAYSLAEPFLQGVGKVWGRDYITVALLSIDPSLKKIAEEADTNLETLRDEWFAFVTKDGRHRDPESWTEWWYKANVPLPDNRTLPSTDNVYLITWDPTRSLIKAEAVQRVKEEGTAIMNWSVGDHGAKVGDRVFLMRHGEDMPGLVGSGQIVSDVHEDQHWDKDAPTDYTAFYALVLWDTLQEFPLISLEKLIKRIGEKELWTKHGCGFLIEPAIAEPLESAWKEASSRQDPDISSPSSTTETVTPIPWVDTDAIPVIGDLRKYQPSKQDSLEAEAQAKIFATLLVAEKVRPPLALGLLGDWGVGKTFFMRLMQESVASIAGKGARAESNSDSVSRAAQIEFNAWHYMDSDLWASLASHIFDGLSEELRGPSDKVEKIRRRLRRRVNSSNRERKEATASIGAAQKERQKAAIKLENKQAERAGVAAKYESHRLKRAWKAVLKIKPDPDKPGESDWPNVAELKEKAECAAKRLGITQTINSVEELQRVYKSMRELSRRGSGLATAFAAAFTGKRVWISGTFVAGLLALVIAWPWILEQIDTVLGATEATASKLLAPFLRLASVVSVAAGWATRNLKSISSAIGYLEQPFQGDDNQ